MPVRKPATKPAAKKSAAAPEPVRMTAAAAKPRAAAKAAPPPAPAPSTVTLKVLAAEFAAQHAVPKSQADAMLSDMVGLLVQHLKAGDRLRLVGLGILEVKNRPARTGRNPATGAEIQIQASRKIAFRAAKELKEAI
jgi:DNA-binding protein HU-beta